MIRTAVRSLTSVLLLAVGASAQAVALENFTSGDGGWLAGPFSPTQMHETSGGNPGGWLHCTSSGSNPEWYSPSGSPVFGGNFQARGVSGAVGDLRQDSAFNQHSMWLVLRSGTVMVAVQADGAALSPPGGAGWIHYHFTIPSSSPTLPAGWISFGAAANTAWNTVITNVGTTEFHQANNPFLGFDLPVPPPGWNFGIDNPGIEVPTGVSFCNGDGGDQMGCTNCPCGNNAPLGTNGGCTNSVGTSALLIASGSPNVSTPADTLHFDLTGGTFPGSFGVLLSGANQLPNAGACPPGSGITSATLDGLRCVGGSALRHGSRSLGANGSTSAGWGPPANPTAGIGVSAGFVAGQTRHFQVFYRETPTLGCMTGQNTTNAVSITFN